MLTPPTVGRRVPGQDWYSRSYPPAAEGLLPQVSYSVKGSGTDTGMFLLAHTFRVSGPKLFIFSLVQLFSSAFGFMLTLNQDPAHYCYLKKLNKNEKKIKLNYCRSKT